MPASAFVRCVSVLASLAALTSASPVAATDYDKVGALIRGVEIVVPDFRVEYWDSRKLGYVLSWPLSLGVAGVTQPSKMGAGYACPATNAVFRGADLLVEPQVAFGGHASAGRILGGAILRVGRVWSKEHQPSRRDGWTGALQGGGLLGRDGNGAWAGVGFQLVSFQDNARRLVYAAGLWVRGVRTTRGDRVEIGLDLLQLPWLVNR